LVLALVDNSVTSSKGEWRSGRVREWGSGGVGEWESEGVGEWGNKNIVFLNIKYNNSERAKRKEVWGMGLACFFF